MGKFKSFLNEERFPSFDVELHLHPHDPPIVHIIKKGALKEWQYHPHEAEGEHHDVHLYKHLGKFKPSSLDHHTITKEFHEHLAKHGYYSHAPSHPMVLSPKEQHFKSEFKKRVSPIGKAQHERPHHDAGYGPKTKTVGRYNALWSTKGSTHVFHNDKNERIHAATKDSHVTVIDDKAVRHAASGHHDRWFVRASEIRKIPRGGITAPTKSGKEQHFGHDINSYINSKRASSGGPKRDVLEFHQKHLKAGTAGTGKHKEVMDWVKKEHPEFHPDHRGSEHGVT